MRPCHHLHRCLRAVRLMRPQASLSPAMAAQSCIVQIPLQAVAAACPNLRKLSVSSTAISDACIVHAATKVLTCALSCLSSEAVSSPCDLDHLSGMVHRAPSPRHRPLRNQRRLIGRPKLRRGAPSSISYPVGGWWVIVACTGTCTQHVEHQWVLRHHRRGRSSSHEPPSLSCEGPHCPRTDVAREDGHFTLLACSTWGEYISD